MSKLKLIEKSEDTSLVSITNKSFVLDNSSHGQKFIQFKSGSSTDFSSNDSGSYWDANRVNFYLSGSDFHFTSITSSYEDGKKFNGFNHTLFRKDTSNPIYTHKFHSTGSTLSISQYYFSTLYSQL